MDSTLISECIKRETAPMHKRLEASRVSSALIAPSVNKKDYLNYLIASYHLHTQVEDTIFPLLTDVVQDVGERRKITAINRDIHSLSYAIPAERPLYSFPGSITTHFALGAMYVTEGATLGGIFLHKHIESHLPGLSYSFLNVYGKNTALCWHKFLDILNYNSKNLPETDKSEILSGAKFIFNAAMSIFENNYVNDL